MNNQITMLDLMKLAQDEINICMKLPKELKEDFLLDSLRGMFRAFSLVYPNIVPASDIRYRAYILEWANYAQVEDRSDRRQESNLFQAVLYMRKNSDCDFIEAFVR